MSNLHPIFAAIFEPFTRHVPDLDALAPRVCACGQPTGSVALDTCETCEGAERARRAIRDMHALAVDSHARARLDAQGAQEDGP